MGGYGLGFMAGVESQKCLRPLMGFDVLVVFLAWLEWGLKWEGSQANNGYISYDINDQPESQRLMSLQSILEWGMLHLLLPPLPYRYERKHVIQGGSEALRGVFSSISLLPVRILTLRLENNQKRPSRHLFIFRPLLPAGSLCNSTLVENSTAKGTLSTEQTLLGDVHCFRASPHSLHLYVSTWHRCFLLNLFPLFL